MLKILKNLKQSWLSVLIIVLLLCLQAAVDLELPNYTSKIVNEGIQSGGIEDTVPNQITTKDMSALLFFTEDDDKILENYFIEDEKYIIKDIEKKRREELADIMVEPIIISQIFLNNENSAQMIHNINQIPEEQVVQLTNK